MDAMDQDTPPDEASDEPTPRWTPDEQMVPALLAGGRRDMMTLCDNDRAWVVAGLTAAGMTAEDIATKIMCSLRTVKKIRQSPVTIACTYAQVETENFRNELRLAASHAAELQRRITAVDAELRRTKAKLDTMIDAKIVGAECCRRCGTPWDAGNTYLWGEKRYCRECARRRAVDRRAAGKSVEIELAVPSGGSQAERTLAEPEDFE